MENTSLVIQDHEPSTGQRWRAEVFVSLKPIVNDPQGLAVRAGLQMLGYEEVDTVRAGKYIELWLSADEREVAEDRVRQMCEKLLANPVIEQYRFRLNPVDAAEFGKRE